MKNSNNQVTVKKEIANRDDSMINLELASKAMINFKQLIASGKNASILNDIANSFVNKKESSNVKALTKDGLLKELQSKVFQCQTVTNARKITSNDNYFDYAKFVKLVMSKKVELNANQKGQVKTIVATAQVLRKGALSKYVHDEMSWLELQQRYGIEEKTAESVTGVESAQESAQESAPIVESVNMETFKALIDSITMFDDAALAYELIKAKMEELAQNQVEKAA